MSNYLAQLQLQSLARIHHENSTLYVYRNIFRHSSHSNDICNTGTDIACKEGREGTVDKALVGKGLVGKVRVGKDPGMVVKVHVLVLKEW